LSFVALEFAVKILQLSEDKSADGGGEKIADLTHEIEQFLAQK
jgi:hypothetical protein